MPWYRVRDGVEIGHNDGVEVRTLRGGDKVQLPRHIAEVEHKGKFERCTEDGKSLMHLSDDEYELALAQPHERESLKKQFAERDAARATAPIVVVNPSAPPPEPSPTVKVVTPAKASTK